MRYHSTIVRSSTALLAFFACFLAGCDGDPSGSQDSASGSPRITTRPTTTSRGTTTPPPRIETANGISELSDRKILAAAKAATLAADWVRIRGEYQAGTTRTGLDVRAHDGKLVAGYVTENDERVDLIRIRSTLYLKPDDVALNAVTDRRTARMLAGNYLKVPVKDDFAVQMLPMFDTAGVLTELFAETEDPSEFVLRPGTKLVQLNGHPAILLSDSSEAKVYVAAEGKPYLLRFETADGMHVDFLAYGKATTVERPPTRRVVDFTTTG